MRITKTKRKLLAKRAEKRATAKTRRITQTRNHTRSRRAIDRAAIFERDRGVCAICKCDTQRLVKWLAEIPLMQMSHGNFVCVIGRRDRFVVGRGATLGRHRHRALTLLGRLWKVRLGLGAHLHEIDHELPIIEGGSDEDSNLRTLCRRCHRGCTSSLKARLARRPTKAVGRGF